MDPVKRLFLEGGPVMATIAIASIAAWTLIFFKWADLSARRDPAALLQDVKGDGSREKQSASLTPAVEAEKARMEQGLGPIAALAALLPLLGLLGTVLGMLETFGVIRGHGMGDARLLAGGIRQALLTTQAGLFAAVPVVLGLQYLRSMASKLSDALSLQAHRMDSAEEAGGAA